MVDLTSRQNIVILSTSVLVFILGFILGTIFANYRAMNAQPITGMNKLEIFTSATASIQGKVVNVDNNVATIQSIDGSEGKYVVNNNVGVFTLKPGVKEATVSSALDQSLLNKDVLVRLDYQNGQFEIVSISVLP